MTDETQVVSDQQPPFYFTVVFWGETHRNYFLDLLLASLLSPNNIPILQNKTNACFLISCPKSDWNAIQAEPMFLLLQQYIKPVWLELESPDPNDPNPFESKMVLMSKGHKLCAQKAFTDKAIGVFVTPDLILSDGSVAAMERLAYSGWKVVLSFAIRFEHFGCMAEFKLAGLLKKGQPLTVSARDLVAMAAKNFHSETVRYMWDTNYYAETPVTSIWPTSSDQRNFVAHSYSLAPLVANYNAIQKHDTITFDEWTIDGDYIYKNFGDDKAAYLVTDSDEITLVSFTKEEELHIPKKIDKQQLYPLIGKQLKMFYLSRLHHSKSIDPLKRRLILQTIHFHADDLTKHTGRVARKAKKIISEAVALIPDEHYAKFEKYKKIYPKLEMLKYKWENFSFSTIMKKIIYNIKKFVYSKRILYIPYVLITMLIRGDIQAIKEKITIKETINRTINLLRLWLVRFIYSKKILYIPYVLITMLIRGDIQAIKEKINRRINLLQLWIVRFIYSKKILAIPYILITMLIRGDIQAIKEKVNKKINLLRLWIVSLINRNQISYLVYIFVICFKRGYFRIIKYKSQKRFDAFRNIMFRRAASNS